MASVFFRRGAWHIQVEDPSGERDKRGRKRKIQRKTKAKSEAAALLAAAEFEAAIALKVGPQDVPEGLTLDEAWGPYLERREARGKNTHATKSHWRVHIGPALGTYPCAT